MPCFSYGISYFYVKEIVKVTEKILSQLISGKGDTPRNLYINRRKFVVPSGRLTGSVSINLGNMIDFWHFYTNHFAHQFL